MIRTVIALVPLLALTACGTSNNARSVRSIDSLTTTVEMETSLVPKSVRYHVYLPPSYQSGEERTYPVIYWLHGSGGYPPGVVAMLARRFDNAIRNGRIPEHLVVFTDGLEDTMWLNSKDGTVAVEDLFIQELVPHIDSTYRTIASRGGRILEGASMGGYGAARFGFKYPDLFAAVSMINPGPMQPILDVDEAPLRGRDRAQETLDGVYGGDQRYFMEQSPWRLVEQNASAIRSSVEVRMILGELDLITPNNIRFSEHLKDLNIDHQVIIIPDVGHDGPRAMFSALTDDYWDFFN